MSIHAVSWALRQELPPVPKFVLVALCERANGKTGQCWPGIDEVAEAVCLSQRSVVTYIAMLVNNGYVTKEAMRRKNGQKANNHYWICFDRQPAEWVGPGAHKEVVPLENEENEATEPAPETVASLQQADFAHGPSPVENGASAVENHPHHAQTDSPGPCATVCTRQESLAEPEYFKPSLTVPVEGRAAPPAVPPGFSAAARIEQAKALRAAEEANKPKLFFVIEGSEAWKAQVRHGHKPTLTTWGEFNGKRYRGWYFESYFPPKSTGPPRHSLEASLDDLEPLAKEMNR